MTITARAVRRLGARHGRLPAMALAAVVLVGTTSCSGADPATGADQSEVPSTEVDPAAVELLPDAIASSKLLRVAIPTNEPPTQFYAEGTRNMTGINPDIARLVGQALGVEVEIVVANFDSIIPGIAAGRFDMTVSSMTPTEERMEVLDFVEYMQVGNSVAVPKGNPEGLDENALCGKSVGFLTASYQLTYNAPLHDEACVAAGEDTLEKDQFQDTRQAISALTSGRLDAVIADGPIVDFAASKNPEIEVSSRYDVAPVAIGVPKDTGLVDAVAAAMKVVVASDEYLEVLGNYGVESNAITDARVNIPQ